MVIIQKGLIGLKGTAYYIQHLSIINPFLPVELTPKEREVLGTFMSFKGDAAEKDRFGPTLRTEVKALLKQILSTVKNELPTITEEEALRQHELMRQACLDISQRNNIEQKNEDA